MDTHVDAGPKDVRRFVDEKPGPYGHVVLLGLKPPRNLPRMIAALRKGFPWKTFERFRTNTGLSTEQIAEMISLPRRTLARRKAEGRLDLDQSDRLLRAARIYGRALHLFDGDRERATMWLVTHNMALGGVPPIEFMRTELGATEVERVIGRAEHGVYS